LELHRSIARNTLLLLRYLLERERHPESEIPEIPAISMVIGLTQHETRDLIDILDDAATAIKDMEVRGAPLISDYGIS
jgi:hypothetical protein